MKKGTGKYCWTIIGIRGNRSCPELSKHIHCRNCPRYESAGRDLLDREPPGNYIEELTEMIARPEIKKDGLQKTVIVFRLGSEWLGLPVGLFVELTRPRPIRRVPHRSNSVFLGLISIRGDMQMCFSAGGLLGIQPAPGDKTTTASGILRRFCVISKHNRKWVFPVDEVCGLCNYAENEVQPVPVNVAKTMQKYTVGIIDVNKRQIGLINDDLIFAAFERSLS
ncbi:MAG: chemotaxis protein CheW [Kiritimatiellia bacterium]|nr:chemotaxis protein CheW [Kiritimatiellia bacterium]